MNKFFVAITALIGTIIGAGVLGIPYVVMKSGFPIGFFHILIIGIVILITMLYLGEITLRTSGNHQLSGYAQKYLGNKAKHLMFLSLAFGIYSAILAYLIGKGESLSFLFFGTTQYALYLGILIWIMMSILSYYGLSALEKGDALGVTAIFLLIISITILFSPSIKVENLSYINFNNILFPFGVVLFAYLAFSIVPEIKKILSREKTKIKSAMIYAYFLTFLIYVVFAVVVLGYKGSGTPEIATLALGKPFIILGMLTMFTSYLSLSIALIDNFKIDYKFSKLKAWLSTITIPLLLFIILEFTKSATFTTVLGIGGAISGSLTALLILLMIKKAKKKGDRKPEYKIPSPLWLLIALAILFILGTLAEIIRFF